MSIFSVIDKHTVECCRVMFESEALVPVLAVNLRAAYENRRFIRLAPCNDFVVSSLAKQIIEASEAKLRFRVYECLRTIKLILRNNEGGDELSDETICLLFRLYQVYIFSPKEETQWCVGSYIRGRELRQEHVEWLIQHADQSVHILNRLLRYPSRHALIKLWAAKTFENNAYPDRQAEIAGLLIEDCFPAALERLSAEKKMWAAYYSRVSLEQKEKMLINSVDAESSKSALDIALRLRLPHLLRRLCEVVPE